METRRKAPVKVRCDQTGVIYDSIRSAAKQNNIRPSRLREHLKGFPVLFGLNGLTFKKVE